MTPSSTIVVQADQNILQFTAEFIFDTFNGQNYTVQAPDFSNLFVFLPHAQVTQPFNEALCRSLGPDLPAITSRDGRPCSRYGARSQEGGAIIPPWADTLKAWTKHFVSNQYPAENDSWQIIGEQTRQLLFIEALQQYPDLFKEENQWQVTQALLSLFDELSLNQQDIFTSPEELQLQLQQAYGIEQQHEHLLYESKLVYTLWHAWQKQLSENQLYDETADYLSRLQNAPAVINKQQQFICLGLSQYSKTEQDFIQYLISKNQCHVIEFAHTIKSAIKPEIDAKLATDATANIDAGSAFAAFISETFTPSTQSFKQRALRFASKYPETSSSKLPFSTYLASNEEEQIRAIDYYVRLNVLDGKSNIAIISEDRKLSRRLRALLERANIQLQDKAGWSLATTQAATVIERWLECIEEDFSAYPLLDCLKSPFINITPIKNESADNASIRQNFKKNIYRFEQDLIFHENISSNIEQYKARLKQRITRLSHWPADTYDELINTLNYIQKTAAPLTNFYTAEKNIALADFLDALLNSLQQLGILQGYLNDNAGLVLLKTFETLKQSIRYSNPELSWYDCRIWLAMALESQNFRPATNDSRVQLMTLEQASHLNFDCVVVAATESQHYPGSAKNQPFFNQAVRASLGLNTWEKQRQQRHELFNRVLLSAPDILLTACFEENGEEKPVSPWLELLLNFYQLAYNRKPDNPHLQQLVLSNSEVFNSDETELPEQSSKPAPVIPENLIPEKVSASAYQRIINCPYQYFCADGLRLKALEELTEELKKSDYGERIHLILQCFHHGHSYYGKAFDSTITEVNAKQAEQYLSKLSEKIFLADLENNILHRSWLYRWQKHIPAYINWQIKQQLNWSTFLSEKNLEVTLDKTLQIVGRLDRIDKSKENNTHAIIDYKTGKTARQDDIDIGENVQLSIYALLDTEASEVSYLSVDSSYQKVETKSSLTGEDLEINREQNKQRLIELFRQMKNRQPMPAWGDDMVCRYCNFSGLCRKAEWGE
ncbi:MAG: PD-(D/E)XK nuclease family protein [Gammaproteobacteria bacterium]